MRVKVCFYFYLFIFLKPRVSCNSRWPQTWYTTLNSWPFWSHLWAAGIADMYRHLIYAMPGIECRAFCMLSEHSTNSHISSTSDNVEAISFCLSPVKVWEHNSYTTSDTPELNTTQFLTHSLVLFSTSSVWSPDILTLWLICLTHHVLRYLCLLKLELFDTRKLFS